MQMKPYLSRELPRELPREPPREPFFPRRLRVEFTRYGLRKRLFKKPKQKKQPEPDTSKLLERMGVRISVVRAKDGREPAGETTFQLEFRGMKIVFTAAELKASLAAPSIPFLSQSASGGAAGRTALPSEDAHLSTKDNRVTKKRRNRRKKKKTLESTGEPVDGPAEEAVDGPAEEPVDGPSEEPIDGPTVES